jgi:hypothetical protein
LLSNFKGDLFGCLANCSSKGQCEYTNRNTFECKCYELRGGVACENNLHPCASTKCLNDGKCYELASFNGIDNFDVGCNCSGLYYGSKCQEKINVCVDKMQCSGHGVCYEKNSLPFCKCYSKYEGDRCEVESVELKKLKDKISITSYLAFFIIALCFGFFIFLDLIGILINKARNMKNKRKKSSIVFRYKYKNFD